MIACEGERCRVEGPITTANVTAVLAEGTRLFSAPQLFIDLSGVTEVDSAAVSLLLEWQRGASKTGRRVEYQNIPPNLKTLAELYGVIELLAKTER